MKDELEFLRELEQDVQRLQAYADEWQRDIAAMRSKLNARIIEVLEAKSDAIQV